MTDDARSTAIETPDAPAIPPRRRRLWYLAATIVVAAIIAAYVMAPQSRPLSPMETRLVGKWARFEGDRVVARLAFTPDRSCSFEQHFGGRFLKQRFLWRIEASDIYLKHQRDLGDYYNAIINMEVFSQIEENGNIHFVSDDEVQLGGSAGETYIRQTVK